MKFAVSTIIAFAAAVLAQPKLTNSKFDVVEGEPFIITWMDAEGPVTLTLKNGDPENLKDVTVITAGATGEEFTWIPENLPSDTYAIEISDASGVPNYSVPFEYEGTGTAPSASSSSPVSSTTASSTMTSEASSTVPSSSVTSSESSSTAESSSMRTSTTSTTTRSAPTTTPTNQNSEGQRFSSPLALLLVTVAAVMFFN